MSKVLVTGAAGFIGFHVCKMLMENNYDVVGIDNLSNYYSKLLKESRIKELQNLDLKNVGNFEFKKINIVDQKKLNTLFNSEKFGLVIHLAAQAGVRYSIENPRTYVENNVIGFFNLMDECLKSKIQKFYYASSSSVYGNQIKVPYSENDQVNKPESFYAATKISNELMAHAYSSIHKLKTTGLRFFTVYGPWGRPDMAPMIFLDALYSNSPINIFNSGKLERDFTFITDVSSAIIKLIETDKNISSKNYRIFNIGNSNPIVLTDFIDSIETLTKKKFIKKNMQMQPGDVFKTHADVISLEKIIGPIAHTPLNEGLKIFIDWYKSYYNV